MYKQTHNVATSFCSPKEAKLRQWTEWRTRVRLLLARRRVHCHLESVGVYVAAAAMAFLPKTIWFATVDDSQQVHAQAHTHRRTHIHSVSVTTTTTKCLPMCCLVMIRSIANFTFSLLTAVQCTLLFCLSTNESK